MLRDALEHPFIPLSDSISSIDYHDNPTIQDQMEDNHYDFRHSSLGGFTLDYLFKFIYNSKIKNINIHGGLLPLNQLKLNTIIDLNLSEQNLFSEDIYILSVFINKTVKNLNLAQNNIGFKCLEGNTIG